ncbi:MAG: zf-HC2 domain-containing protein [Thermoanaerobaculia bacterium]
MTSENHRCEPWQRQLDDFVDERLSPRDQAELQRHLDGCESCRREAEELEGLLAAARELPRALQPPWDSWPDIEARLSSRSRRPRLRGWVPQAIAAALLIAIGGASSRWLWPPSAATEIAEARISDERATTGEIELARAETEYLRVKESLWISIYHHHDQLSPMTVSVVEHNLRTIDKAIEEIHQALEQDPGNPRLESQLFANHRRGIGLLRRLATASKEI